MLKLFVDGIHDKKMFSGDCPMSVWAIGDRRGRAQWRVRALKAIGIHAGFQERGKVVEKTATTRRMIPATSLH